MREPALYLLLAGPDGEDLAAPVLLERAEASMATLTCAACGEQVLVRDPIERHVQRALDRHACGTPWAA
jgi:hypothetical protein